MHSLKLADQQGNWKLASWLEKIPHSQRPGLHEVVIKGLVNQANLYDKATKASGFGGEEPEGGLSLMHSALPRGRSRAQTGRPMDLFPAGTCPLTHSGNMPGRT